MKTKSKTIRAEKMSELEKVLEEIGGKGTVETARARGNTYQTVLDSFNRPVQELVEK